MILQSLMLLAAIGMCCLFSTQCMVDDGRRGKGHIFDENHHRESRFGKGDDEGNETAGQIAAWLLVVANVPVILSILIKQADRLASGQARLKDALFRFNRFQKKHLMRLHYFLNPLILGIAAWHWMSSRCRSTALPEWGLVTMIVLMGLGLSLKFKLCPKPLRKSVYRIHTQPLLFASMAMLLTVGHMMVD